MSECRHENTAVASAICSASAWCPDCRKWVQIACKHGVILYGNRCLNCEREANEKDD